jgi:hypothetical protein
MQRSKGPEVLGRALCHQRDLDPLLVVPTDVRVQSLRELLNARVSIEQFVLESPEEALTARIVR